MPKKVLANHFYVWPSFARENALARSAQRLTLRGRLAGAQPPLYQMEVVFRKVSDSDALTQERTCVQIQRSLFSCIPVTSDRWMWIMGSMVLLLFASFMNIPAG